MNDIPADLVDKMMVKCGRRCCICRRFRPTKLQVHHIVERNQGGDNDEDNLIVICLSCHSDVHTTVPFTRRFTAEELKGHRDEVVRAVQEGRLLPQDEDDTDRIISTIVRNFRDSGASRSTLVLPEAIELLLAAASAKGAGQGSIMAHFDTGGFTIQAGDVRVVQTRDKRIQAKYDRAIGQLIQAGLATRPFAGNIFDLTYDGYLVADEISARGTHALE